MQSVGASHAKTHFSQLLEEVKKGHQIIITKYGHPVARLVPATDCHPMRIKNAIERLQAFAKENNLGGLNWKELRDEGRR